MIAAIKKIKTKSKTNLPPDGAKEPRIWTPFTNHSLYVYSLLQMSYWLN